MSLQLRRIGGISEEEHASDMEGKVTEILDKSDCVAVVGGSATPAAPPFLSAFRREGKRPAATTRS